MIDCYFCVVKIDGINPDNQNNWRYTNIYFAQRPQLKSREVQPSSFKSSNDPNPCEPELNTSSEDSDSYHKYSQEPQPFNQKEKNGLVRDVNLPKEATEILASPLKEKFAYSRNKHYILSYQRKKSVNVFFSREGLSILLVVFCNRRD